MPATAMPALGAGARLVGDRALDQAAHVAGQRLELERAGRVVGDVALAVADDAGLQRGVEGDLLAGADDQLGRAAADVDHQRRHAGRVLAGGAEVGEARLFLAVEDAGREGEALAQLGDEGAAVGGVAHGAGRDRVDVLDPGLAADRDVVGDRRAGRLDRLGRELARRGRRRGPAGSPGSAARPRSPAPRRRRRSAAASSWSRCRSPPPCESPSIHAGGTLETTAHHVASMALRRGVEQPGSSSGS